MFQSKLLSKISGIQHAFLTPQEQPPENFLRVQQVHGRDLVLASADNFSQCSQIQSDGLITDSSRAVAVQTADCLPVLYATNDGKFVAAVHAGWRGLHKGILIETVKQLQSKGYKVQDIFVAIGPAIGACCFEVDQSVQDAFQKDWGHLWGKENASPLLKAQAPSAHAARSVAKPSANNLWIDLERIARLQLASLGIPNTQIEDVGFCTYCGPKELASFRRATHEGVKAARQWSFIQKINA